MTTAAPQRNTDAEYEAFGAICERLVGFDRTLSPFHVDGWLTAMACGPVRLPSAQWLELMCGDAFERAFADPPDRAQALAALQARLDVLHSALDAEALLDRPDEIRIDPFFDDWTDEQSRAIAEGTEATAEPTSETTAKATAETAASAKADPLRDPLPGVPPDRPPELLPEEAEHMAGALWADGFLIGLEALTDAWRLPKNDERVDTAMRELGAQFEALLHDHDSDELRKFLAEYHEGKALDRDALLLNACFAVQDLRLFLLDHGPKPKMRRVEAQPGRNDPCPCGSGKKFKKCHGALA